MRKSAVIAILFAALLPLSACSMMDKLTGQTDDTVLPGPREDAIPGRTQYPAEAEQPKKTSTTAETPAPTEIVVEEAKPCPADQPDCVPPATDDTFSDGQ